MAEENSFRNFLAEAWELKKQNEFPKGADILVVDRLERFFVSRLNCLLLDKNIIESEMYLCADYIARTLAGYAREFPSTFRAAEYLYAYLQCRQSEKSGEPIRREDYLVRAGQACFVISVFFPCLHHSRRVDERYYAEMGATFFYQYFLESGKEVAQHMAERFDELVPLTQEAIEF
ncbi:MAG TPA: hypothetical protein VMD74_02525 [Candidatus Methylomirabilis sp.]|nr:hypothetical protein [Candidatus Methylomirabilis sp.]